MSRIIALLLILFADVAAAADKKDVDELIQFVVNKKQPGIRYMHYHGRDFVSIAGVTFDHYTAGGIERVTVVVPYFAPNARGVLVRVPWSTQKDVVIMLSKVPSDKTDFYSSSGPRLVMTDDNSDGTLDQYAVGDAATVEIEQSDKKPSAEEQTFYDKTIERLLALYRSLN